MRMPELKSLARDHGLRNYSRMRKAELVALVVMYYTPAHFSELECVHYYCVVLYTHAVLLAH